MYQTVVLYARNINPAVVLYILDAVDGLFRAFICVQSDSVESLVLVVMRIIVIPFPPRGRLQCLGDALQERTISEEGGPRRHGQRRASPVVRVPDPQRGRPGAAELLQQGPHRRELFREDRLGYGHAGSVGGRHDGRCWVSDGFGQSVGRGCVQVPSEVSPGRPRNGGQVGLGAPCL